MCVTLIEVLACCHVHYCSENSCHGHMPAAVLLDTQLAVAASFRARTCATAVVFGKMTGLFSRLAWHLRAGARLELFGLCVGELNRAAVPRRLFMLCKTSKTVRSKEFEDLLNLRSVCCRERCLCI
jgi:hypothetical protein